MEKNESNLKAVGARGEYVVRRHLEGLGWTILEENFRCPSGELDLIAEEPGGGGNVIVFVEVKTRRGSRHGSPISAIDGRKRARMISVATAYLGIRNAGGAEPACRFDIAEVRVGPDGLGAVTLHRAAFTA